MIIQFTEAELRNMKIQPVERQECAAAYRDEREQVWAGQMQRVLARNGNMWNGEVYTLEDMLVPAADQVTLRMGTCEYKDLVFGMLKGQAYIAERYGQNHLPRFTGVNCVPRTQDGKYVFGIRADRPEQGEPPIGGIGGTLNKDEMEIHSFTEIRQGILREIHEETALPCNVEDLRFFCLFAAHYSYHFWFAFRLPIHSAEINDYCRPGEFSRLVAITEAEAWEMKMPMTGAFRRWRPYLHLLSSILDGQQPMIYSR
jgi:hypothetical protein